MLFVGISVYPPTLRKQLLCKEDTTPSDVDHDVAVATIHPQYDTSPLIQDSRVSITFTLFQTATFTLHNAPTPLHPPRPPRLHHPLYMLYNLPPRPHQNPSHPRHPPYPEHKLRVRTCPTLFRMVHAPLGPRPQCPYLRLNISPLPKRNGALGTRDDTYGFEPRGVHACGGVRA
jgi:hypothetical protein